MRAALQLNPTRITFARSKANPCLFYLASKQIRMASHGDDFTVLAYPNQIAWLHEQLKQHLEITIRDQISQGPKDNKVASILNRLLEWTNESVLYEPDARHADITLKVIKSKIMKNIVNNKMKKINSLMPKIFAV